MGCMLVHLRLQALQGVALRGDAHEAIDCLSYELDSALEQLATASAEVAHLQAALEQQQSHIRWGLWAEPL